MRIYFDSSFLVSLYSMDSNSGTAAATMETAMGDRVVTTFGELEVVNALALRVFRKEISGAQARQAFANFATDLREGVFQLCPLPDQVFERALELSRQTTVRLGTRTADLLHVAAALAMEVDYLYTFDQQQRRLAHTLRLKLNRAP